MKIKSTARGFAVGEFKDYYGQICSIQKSSLATADAIWFGVTNTGEQMGDSKNQDVEHGRMHLTQAQVKKLLPTLTKFAETGEIR